MDSELPDHYATLGVDPGCSEEEIRTAYRARAKRHHPDLNQGSREAVARTQDLNAAYATLGDASRRRAYDEEREKTQASRRVARGVRPPLPIAKDAHIGIADFLRGTTLSVTVKDPANPAGPETYSLEIPPDTAPGSRFRVRRHAPFENGWVVVRVKVRPDARFKARGSDLRCDLKINTQRAAQGGVEMVRTATGGTARITIPRNVERGAILRVAGEGLPRVRGGRGDLLVRILYRPEVTIRRFGG